MASKDRQRGKALELFVGRLFGGRRRRNGEGLGYDDCIQADGQEMPISFEVKAHEKLQIRQAWIDQAKRNAGGRPWCIVQRPKGSQTIYATLDLNVLCGLALQAGVITKPEEDDGRLDPGLGPSGAD